MFRIFLSAITLLTALTCHVGSLEARTTSVTYLGEDGYTTTVNSTHSGAFQTLQAITFRGDQIELYDGSIWNVRLDDSYKVLRNQWLPRDPVFISRESTYFSSHSHTIVNMATGDEVHVEMSEGPLVHGPATYLIDDIDDFRGRVLLSDGSVWSVSLWDAGMLNAWILDEPVAIGISKDRVNKNILVNFRLGENVRATCLN